MIELRLDANREIRKLIRDFGKMPPDLRKELRPALVRGAQPILAQARANASWSTRIPKATRINPRFGKRRSGVSITTSARRAPHARPYENLGSPGTFRHPRYGNPHVWVDQAARPFLFRAVEQQGAAVTRELAETVMEIGRRHGWDR